MRKLLLAAMLWLWTAPAFALICPSVPNVFVNGSVADANQMNANFNTLLNCLNTNVAGAGANTNISSLLGLSTPLSLLGGGTGSPTGDIPFTQTGTGAVTRSILAKLKDFASAFDFGGVANQTTDAAAAIQDVIAREAALAGDGMRVVDLGGLAYAISRPITVPTGIRLTNFKLFALASASWTTANAMVQTTAGQYNIAVDHGYLDGNSQTYNAYQNNASGNSSFDHLRAVHFLARGLDIEAPVTGTDSEASQWTPADSQFNAPTNRTAYPLYIGAGGTDSQFTGLTPYVGLSPVYITGAHNVRFVNFHPWNGRTDGTPIVNPLIMDIQGAYNIAIDGGYLDTGYINCNIQLFSSCFLSITGSFGFYNSAAATYAQSIRVTTQVANSDLHGLKLSGNNWPGGALSTVSLATTGSGSWNLSTTAAASYNGDFDTSRLTAFQTLSSSQALIQGYDGQLFLTGNVAGTMTLTAPPTLVPPFDMEVVLPSGSAFAVNINTTGSGVINNASTSVNLNPGTVYHLICYQNVGGSAAKFSLQ